MYESYFHLDENPFALTADPRYLFKSKPYREALAYLAQGIFGSKGVLALAGDVGVGKTTVVRAFIDTFLPCLDIAFVLNPEVGFEEILYMSLQDDGCEARRTSKVELLTALKEFIKQCHSEDRNPTLIIDEAQNLPPDMAVLEKLRVMSTLETANHVQIQIVLVGQPELANMLNRPGLERLRQRIPDIHRMGEMTREEVEQYIMYRLQVAGLQDGRLSFTADAYEAIYNYSNGNPRLINLVCDKTLQLCFLSKATDIKKELVEESAQIVACFDDPA